MEIVIYLNLRLQMLSLAINATIASRCTTLNALSTACLICLITVVILFSDAHEMLEYIYEIHINKSFCKH